MRTLEQLDRDELAVLVREYLLAGQLMDRAGMPHLISRYGRDEMGVLAIEEWMGASPIYSRRVQRLLGYQGDTIDTMFKGLQLDIGAPPEFMDFRLRVIDDHHGEFWLDHCGALMDVEPMGEDFVHTMCHAIEDPTFDATAIATNRRARIRPIHRPPREPSDRHPHCHWTAVIDPDNEPLPDPEAATHIATTLLAQSPVPEIERVGEGWHDYSVPLDPDLRMEWFSRAALVELAREVAVQSHLLTMSLLFAVERRHGRDDATEIGERHFAGSAGLTSERIRDAFGLDTSVTGLAQVLELHPAFQPRSYVDVSIEPDETSDTLVLRLSSCDATREPEHRNWMVLLTEGRDAAITTAVQGVDLRFRAERIDDDNLPSHPGDNLPSNSAGGVFSWRITRAEDPARESSDVALTRFSTGATWEFSETPVALS